MFSKPRGIVVPNRKHPNATGYSTNLYELRGFPSNSAQQVEQNFFRPIDDIAARALGVIEGDFSTFVWHDDLRSAWSRFLLSLLIRVPEQVEWFRSNLIEGLRDDPEIIEEFERGQNEGGTETLDTFLNENNQPLLERGFFQMLMNLIDNEAIGTELNGMIWSRIDLRGSKFPLLTSDRPVIRTIPLNGRNGHIAIPISPYSLFLAATNDETIDRAVGLAPTELVREMNSMIVENARKYVFGQSDSQLRFVENRFGRKRQPDLLSNSTMPTNS